MNNIREEVLLEQVNKAVSINLTPFSVSVLNLFLWFINGNVRITQKVLKLFTLMAISLFSPIIFPIFLFIEFLFWLISGKPDNVFCVFQTRDRPVEKRDFYIEEKQDTEGY